jgi:hypothetical protein
MIDLRRLNRPLPRRDSPVGITLTTSNNAWACYGNGQSKRRLSFSFEGARKYADKRTRGDHLRSGRNFHETIFRGAP